MLHWTIEALLDGSSVQSWYQAALAHWKEVLAAIDPTDPHAIANVASMEQNWFERNCGGRYIGQEIMVTSGIAQYYSTSTGFDHGGLEEATAMYQGLLQSSCSSEIKTHAREMAKSYEELTED